MNELASKISDSELKVMRVLWNADEALPIAQVKQAIAKTSSWDNSTIKTLIRRLCEKGIVSAEKREVYYYTPCVSKKEYKEYCLHSLIDKLYSGSAKNLVASLVQSDKLDQNDIEELRALFDKGIKS